MAKKVYIGVNSVARRVKKIYIGVNGVARKVKKGYIGVAGIAKLFYVAVRSVRYKETISNCLSQSRGKLGATTCNNKAFFGGGNYYGALSGTNTNMWHSSDVVDVVDEDLTVVSPTGLYDAVISPCSTSLGQYALFAYGEIYMYGASQGSSNALNIYNSSLTRSKMDMPAVEVGISYAGAASIGNYSLFGGGCLPNASGSDVPTTNRIDIINNSLTFLSDYMELYQSQYKVKGMNTNSYAYLGGGKAGVLDSNYVPSKVDAFNSSLTQSHLSLSSKRQDMAAAAMKQYAFWAGGADADGYQSTKVDVFDSSNTRISVADLTPNTNTYTGSDDFIGCGGEDCVVIAHCSGYNGHVIETYNDSLTKTTITSQIPSGDTSFKYEGRGATNLNDYFLFGGGLLGQTATDAVTIFETY